MSIDELPVRCWYDELGDLLNASPYERTLAELTIHESRLTLSLLLAARSLHLLAPCRFSPSPLRRGGLGRGTDYGSRYTSLCFTAHGLPLTIHVARIACR